MRDLIDLLERADAGSKIDRSAFLYLPAEPPAGQFAQCSTCVHFRPDAERCGILGKNDKVTEAMSCGFYLHGTPSDDQESRAIVTPKLAGLVDGPVRCRNCDWFDAGKCGLYEMLTKAHPEAFALGRDVEADACCNAWQKRQP